VPQAQASDPGYIARTPSSRGAGRHYHGGVRGIRWDARGFLGFRAVRLSLQLACQIRDPGTARAHGPAASRIDASRKPKPCMTAIEASVKHVPTRRPGATKPFAIVELCG